MEGPPSAIEGCSAAAYRRDCLGELIQIDGSEHCWFEGRGPHCTLLVYIDDATSRLMHLQFVESESTFDYFAATRAYLERYGKPVAFYSDKHSIFRVSREDAASGVGMTQFGRALSELNIEILCANTSQAKGRVERAHHTLQDRLVKELRLAGISTVEAANAFLPGFVQPIMPVSPSFRRASGTCIGRSRAPTISTVSGAGASSARSRGSW